jgi:hypothetical protein
VHCQCTFYAKAGLARFLAQRWIVPLLSRELKLLRAFAEYPSQKTLGPCTKKMHLNIAPLWCNI